MVKRLIQVLIMVLILEEMEGILIFPEILKLANPLIEWEVLKA